MTCFSYRPGFSDFSYLFTDFPYHYCVKCRIWPFLHKKKHYFRKEVLDTFFYSVRTFARNRQHYFSKYGGTDAWTVPPLQIFGGTVPPVPPRSPPLPSLCSCMCFLSRLSSLCLCLYLPPILFLPCFVSSVLVSLPLSLHLSVSASNLPLSLSTPSHRPSVSVCLSLSVNQSVSLSICLSVCPSICLSIYASLSLLSYGLCHTSSHFCLFNHLYLSLSLWLCLCSVCLCLSLVLCHSESLYVSVLENHTAVIKSHWKTDSLSCCMQKDNCKVKIISTRESMTYLSWTLRYNNKR